jgi:vancomycin resistance protein YoaR
MRAVTIAIVSGVAVALLLSPRLPGPGDREGPAPQVVLLGQPLVLDDHAQREALERVRRFVAQDLELVQPDGSIRPVGLGRIGVSIDKARLSTLVRDLRDHTSAIRRNWLDRVRPKPIELSLPLAFDAHALIGVLLQTKDSVDRAPADARMDLDARKLVPEVDGVLVDVDASRLAIEESLERGLHRVSLACIHVPPKRRLADLKAVQIDAVLGDFETHYDRSEKSRDRTYNLRLAASKLDGHVVLPGEVFDFNDTVGPRDEASGYKVATVIAEGELVDGIGGGTCQISGTLHGAVFFSGLEIVERMPHTRPSAYIKMGLDATVVYPTINFRFRNQFDYPIVLHEFVKNGIVRAEVLGSRRRPRTVTLIRRITSVQPYEELERPDDSLPSGVRALGQRGVAGFSVTRYRIVRDGAHAVRERWTDKYPPSAQIIRIGTGSMARDSVEIHNDLHPEYVADELLVLTQGSEREQGATQDATAGRETTEWREPGKTGEPGWTRKARMPQWESSDSNEEHPKRAPKVALSRGR